MRVLGCIAQRSPFSRQRTDEQGKYTSDNDKTTFLVRLKYVYCTEAAR